ncbi:hypothetical protein SPRG_13476 [Saprolegnia parasitica CBS 223.65]|uniref:Uncharacterized protein n=1 Tax=Saprolegnia parasitica (strain CBS 223.65) TaxID=695850 RepID=A0A067C1A3_SAPPC|nr:hypothetical protein SPRG_13476 [Saprolegnia parasitica CBS 223.65]KDO20331.1 hypothetical protein SPRG_13476 [Saprolegnia parasitica CBS 223.65]|eukprot:XP_012208929.1 hypothetical protein SPRG_13476 [Saprolegnia parasitica CBS 223.65]
MTHYLYFPAAPLPTLAPWDIVRPRHWYPHMNLEQSLMDLELAELAEVANAMFPPRGSNLLSMPPSDDAFFADLPSGADPAAVILAGDTEALHTRACSNYSFSSASVIDDKGRRVSSIRRRYEDSDGRLKAVHERDVDGKRLITKWSKQDKADKGEHVTLLSDGIDKAGFEALWAETPFHKAHAKHAAKKKLEAKEAETAEAKDAEPKAPTSATP